MLKMLVDTSVFHHAASIRAKWIDTGVGLWGGTIPVSTGKLISAEHQHYLNPAKGGSQTRYIASLARAFQDGRIDAYTTDALMIERAFGKNVRLFSSVNYGAASLLAKVRMKQIETLDGFNFALPGDDPMKRLRDYLQRSSDPVFVEIRDALGKVTPPDSNTQDAWHLRCAIVLELDAFLCVDARLRNQVRSMRRSSLRQKLGELVMLPMEICERLGLAPMGDEDFAQFVGDDL